MTSLGFTTQDIVDTITDPLWTRPNGPRHPQVAGTSHQRAGPSARSAGKDQPAGPPVRHSVHHRLLADLSEAPTSSSSWSTKPARSRRRPSACPPLLPRAKLLGSRGRPGVSSGRSVHTSAVEMPMPAAPGLTDRPLISTPARSSPSSTKERSVQQRNPHYLSRCRCRRRRPSPMHATGRLRCRAAR